MLQKSITKREKGVAIYLVGVYNGWYEAGAFFGCKDYVDKEEKGFRGLRMIKRCGGDEEDGGESGNNK